MSDKPILVLGAAGPSGLVVMRHALERGYSVTAYARNATELRKRLGDALDEARITLIECPITSLPEKLCPLLPSFGSIISLLGPNSFNHKGTDVAGLYRVILEELHSLPADKRPYLLIASTQSIVDLKDGFDFFTKLHILFIMSIAAGARRETLAIKEVFLNDLKSNSVGVDWTVCRLNLIKDAVGPVEGARAGYVAKDGWRTTIDRDQLAYWLLNEAVKPPKERKWAREMPALWGDTTAPSPKS
ncbi:uncharacterized protein A1O5_09396 [Cladophialophora psammophila CBS 110553]|uniref:Uncharacterized protein n=1 Tax=Cladophialophora psammophila CBS 110553 TaxID=1182543 RepID=W9WHL7_9EURO|nr:uncharacterized protein A1O5_09396 [Cladophialophora psammophila CBS 110553]EXJ67383.1 hypothetical protein A1O5_09396 [Cladophialophora psammophila CBS 110553]